jgi:pimeloyl-ACP methyl ester carboxylesterase
MPTAQVNGIKLHYESQGSGPPLVFIHGLGSCLEDWEHQVPHFSKRYRVITLDLRGHGRSDKPPAGYSMQLFASDIAMLLTYLRLEPAHIVGISLGGGIAFQLALDSPEIVRTLTVVNSAPEAFFKTFKEKFAIWMRYAIINTMGLQKLGGILAEKLFPNPEEAAEKRKFLERYQRNEAKPYKSSLGCFVGWTVKAQIGTLRMPTLIMAADQDYTPVSLKEEYTPMIPGAKLVVIPDSRHAAPMEKPATFNPLLEEFLAVH